MTIETIFSACLDAGSSDYAHRTVNIDATYSVFRAGCAWRVSHNTSGKSEWFTANTLTDAARQIAAFADVAIPAGF
jgi:hypothetical protein